MNDQISKPSDPEEPAQPPNPIVETPPDDAETMLILGSSQDSVTDFDTLLDTVGDDEA